MFHSVKDGGRKVVYGTEDGVYLSDFMHRDRDPVKVLGLKDVLQVDVLEDYQLLVVLSGMYFCQPPSIGLLIR